MVFMAPYFPDTDNRSSSEDPVSPSPAASEQGQEEKQDLKISSSTSVAYELLFEVREAVGNMVANKTLGETGLLTVPSTSILQVQRTGAAGVVLSIANEPDTLLLVGDRIVFDASASATVELRKYRGLVLLQVDGAYNHYENRSQRLLVEVVLSQHNHLMKLSNTSRATASTLQNFNALLLGIKRGSSSGKQTRNDASGNVNTSNKQSLRMGDLLLLETYPDFSSQFGTSPEFIMIREVKGSNPPRYETERDKARLYTAVVIIGLMLGSAALDVLSVFTAALLAAIAMVALQCMTPDQAFAAVHWRMLITMVAAFGLGAAMDNTRVSAWFAKVLVELTLPLGHIAILAAVFLATAFMSCLISNTATSVLMFPIAFSIAEQVNVGLRPLMAMLMLGASAPYASPIGTASNLLVYGPGKFTFGDFVKFGTPLTLLLSVIGPLLAVTIYQVFGIDIIDLSQED